jgi:hypothetical protein
MLVVDSQIANTAAVEDLQSGALQPLVDWLEENTETYQLGLITFRLDDGTVETDLPFSLDNGTAFLAAMDAISITENAGGSPSNDRPTEIAMVAARDAVWRPTANKVCILLNQGETGLTAKVSQYQIAYTMANAGIEVNAITTPYWPAGTFNADSSEINGKTALSGGGSHSEILSDGTADNNGGTVLLPDHILSLISGLCPPPDDLYRCARPFCGDCTCTCEEICVSVTNMTTDEWCEGIASFDGELCNDKSAAPHWSGTLDCDPSGSMDVEFSLQRNAETDACELIGTIVGSVGASAAVDVDLEPVSVSTCYDIRTSFEFEVGLETYSVAIRCLECGNCDPEICIECCDSVPPYPPATLICRITLATVTQPEPPEPPFSTACWEDLEFPISFLYDIDEDTEDVCIGAGSTRRVDCIGNLLNNEFNTDCCTGGQWIGGSGNGCGDIDVCFVPCGTLTCDPPPPGETLTSWDLYIAVGGSHCSEGKLCLICHDEIAWGVEGYHDCGAILFTVGTGSVSLQVDISET